MTAAPIQYRTRDLYYAAYLLTVGERLDQTSLVGRSVFMSFLSSPTMPSRAQEYHAKRGMVSAATYADNIKNLKSMCVAMVRGEADAKTDTVRAVPGPA